jgi:aminoglycoside 2''-phosphotransferase
MSSLETCLHSFRQTYPDYPLESVEFNPQGQNNDVLVINGTLILRFPRYTQGIEDLKVETAILRGIRDSVSLEIPDPQFVHLEGQPPGQAFIGYPRIPGTPLWRETLHAQQANPDSSIVERLAQQLGQFLKRLHSLPPAQVVPVALPVVDMWAAYHNLYNRMREKLFPSMRPDARQEIAAHFEAFLGDPASFAFQPVLKHGDFGPSNILYDAERQTVCGIIDFSGCALGDPAYDFAGLLSGYGEAFVRSCAAGYPEVEALLPRARFYQGIFALEEALFGIENNDLQAFENGMATYR